MRQRYITKKEGLFHDRQHKHPRPGTGNALSKYKRILKELTIMSDILMRNVFKDRACMEYVLQVLLANDTLRVIDHVVQKDYQNLHGRSVFLDCVTVDADHRMFDVEIQQENEGVSPERVRYHDRLMDMITLNPGQDIKAFPETYVIFITRNDVLGFGLPIYHIKKIIAENGVEFKDNLHVIYVNSEIRNDTDRGRLMHDFHCKNASDMYSEILAKRISELKETKKGMTIMCSEMDEFFSTDRKKAK